MLSFVLLTLNFKVPFFFELTLGRISFLLLIMLIIFRFNYLSINKENLKFINLFLLYNTILFFSTIINKNSFSLSCSFLLPYIEIIILVIFFSFLININFNPKFMLINLVIYSFIINLFVLYFIIKNNAFSFIDIRRFLAKDFIFRNLNPLINTLLFLNLGSIEILFNRKSWSRSLHLISLLNSFIFIFLLLSSGSRQNMLGLIFFICLKIIFDKKISFKNITYILIFIFLIFFLMFFLNLDFIDWIVYRFNISLEQASEVKILIKPDISFDTRDFMDPRLVIWLVGLKEFLIKGNIFFGYGINSFLNSIGLYADNGYINILFETGIIGFIIIIYIISYYTKKFLNHLKKLNKKNDYYNYCIFSTFFSIFLTYTFLLNFFNEIFFYEFYWVFFIIMINFLKNKI